MVRTIDTFKAGLNGFSKHFGRVTNRFATVALSLALGISAVGFPATSQASVTSSCAFVSAPSNCGFYEQAKVAGRATLVSGGRTGGYAVRLHTESGDNNVYGSGVNERDDLSWSQAATGASQGQEQWWSHSILFPTDYVAPPAPTAGNWTWGVVFDFHNTTDGAGQANFQINAMYDGLAFQIYGGDPSNPTINNTPIGPVVKNTWYDFVYHVKWSSGSDGYFYAWVNGVQKLAYNGPTLYTGQGAYLKLANYHTPFGAATSVVHDRIVIGTTQADVDLSLAGNTVATAPTPTPTSTTTPTPTTRRVAGDLDGDGKADVVWRNASNGQNMLWTMNGAAVKASAALPAQSDQNWKLVKVADFDGDGKADILWRHSTTGANQIWLMNGATRLSSTNLPGVSDQNWKVVGTGDFDGDGKADILWRNSSTGANQIWIMKGATVVSATALSAVPDLNWSVAAVGDLNGDGRSDIVWRNAATGQNQAWLMKGTVISSNTALLTVADLNWKVAGMGDFDGDGKADILWRNAGTGENAIFLMNGTVVSNSAYIYQVADQNWKVAGIGDIDGDGRADVIWHNSATGANASFTMNGLTLLQLTMLTTLTDLNWGAKMAQ